MTHPDVTIARSRATTDAMHNRYENRECSKRAKVAYDTKHAELRRAIEALESPICTNEDVRRAEP
jgi:hypothetical protein